MKFESDFHKKGVYAVVTPSGAPIFDTFQETGYSARSDFVRNYNKRWSVAEREGYTVREFVSGAVLLSARDPLLMVPMTPEAWKIPDEGNARHSARALGQSLRFKLFEVIQQGRRTPADAQRVKEEVLEQMRGLTASGFAKGLLEAPVQAELDAAIERTLFPDTGDV